MAYKNYFIKASWLEPGVAHPRQLSAPEKVRVQANTKMELDLTKDFWDIVAEVKSDVVSRSINADAFIIDFMIECGN